MEILIALVALFVGIFIGWIIKPKADVSVLKENIERYRTDNTNLLNENRKLVADNAAVRALNQELPKHIELLSNQILKNQSKESKELVIDPFAKQMKEIKESFDKKIDNMNKDAAETKGSLEKHLEMLKTSAGNLQKGADDFARALRGSKKMQGNWGEAILENILRLLGFRKGFEYDTQVEVTDDLGNKYFLDCVLNLPDSRKIIIDSKMSIESFIKYSNAETDVDKEKYLAEVIEATRKHIKELSDKEYQKKLKDYNLDFVFMLIPREEMYFVVLDKAPELHEEAIKNNIAIVTPSLLYPMMRTVDNLLRIDKQGRNIQEVIDMVNKLYDKYVGFTENFATVGSRLSDAQKSYDAALGQLTKGSGNMSGWFAKIQKKSGIPTNKKIAIGFESDDE